MASAASDIRRGNQIDRSPAGIDFWREEEEFGPLRRPYQLRYKKLTAMAGFGTFGTVHKVLDLDYGRVLAVKVIRNTTSLR